MKKLFKTLLIVAGLATALAPKIVQANQHTTVTERQLINDIAKPTKKYSITNYVGGLPLVTEYQYSNFGLTPKEYGMRYGNGKSRKGKTNMLRVSKQSKFRR